MVKTMLGLMIVPLFLAGALHAAVGCELNDPDRDVRRLFLSSTGYKTEFASVAQSGGAALQHRIEARLGDSFTGLFETADVPYTLYRILKGKEVIGYIHGVNQKGQYGGIQVFLALDLQGRILSFYIQKVTSRQAKLLRDPAFGRQFEGLTLRDLDAWDVSAGKARPGSRAAAIANPAPEAVADFQAILRGVKKNLILCDVFLLGNPGLK